jgi:hypothetical protein
MSIFGHFLRKITFSTTEIESDFMDDAHASYPNVINRWKRKKSGFRGQIAKFGPL